MSYLEGKASTCNAGDSTGQVCIQNTSETTGINHYHEYDLMYTTLEPILVKSSTGRKWFMLSANWNVMRSVTSFLNHVPLRK